MSINPLPVAQQTARFVYFLRRVELLGPFCLLPFTLALQAIAHSRKSLGSTLSSLQKLSSVIGAVQLGSSSVAATRRGFAAFSMKWRRVSVKGEGPPRMPVSSMA